MSETNSVNGTNNPWKIGVYATVGAVALLLAAGYSFGAFSNNVPVTQANAPATHSGIVAPRPQESCAQYQLDAQRDAGRIAKGGAVGAAIGAGTGAAGGAIVDGGNGAGKGAGIGAVVGAVAGAVHGLAQEDTRVSAAKGAYQDCLARNG